MEMCKPESRRDLASRFADWASWVGVVAGCSGLIYLLTAPPIVLPYAAKNGWASFPPGYGPVLSILESDFGGPLLWYFNTVWHADLMTLGDSGVPWYVTGFYLLMGLMLFVALLLRLRKPRPKLRAV